MAESQRWLPTGRSAEVVNGSTYIHTASPCALDFSQYGSWVQRESEPRVNSLRSQKQKPPAPRSYASKWHSITPAIVCQSKRSQHHPRFKGARNRLPLERNVQGRIAEELVGWETRLHPSLDNTPYCNWRQGSLSQPQPTRWQWVHHFICPGLDFLINRKRVSVKCVKRSSNPKVLCSG